MLTVKKYYTSWCVPCKSFAPVFDGIASEYAGNEHVKFESINLEEAPEVTDIRSVPAVIFETNGVEVRRLVGLHHRKSYTDMINSIIGEN